MIATAEIIHLVCRHTKLKALLTGIAFQPAKKTETIFGNENEQQNCAAQWYTIAGNHREMHNIQKKTVFQYSYSYAFLFRHQTICSSQIM